MHCHNLSTLVLVPKYWSFRELSNGFDISSIQMTIDTIDTSETKSVLHSSDLHFPPRGFLRTFFPVIEDIIMSENLLSLLLLQFV